MRSPSEVALEGSMVSAATFSQPRSFRWWISRRMASRPSVHTVFTGRPSMRLSTSTTGKDSRISFMMDRL